MNLQVVGCSHHSTSIAVREKLAFNGQQTAEALDRWRNEFPQVEAVLLSTCNRVELYTAAEQGMPGRDEVAAFLAGCHKLSAEEVAPYLIVHDSREAVRHLFTVASSLDSMVVGETQILGQVKQAYRLASERKTAGPRLHAAFQTALMVARRVAAETAIHQRRVSVPSVAVADFARQIFERFDDKHAVVIGAGEMAEETLRYLREEGTRHITIVNRHIERAEELARRWQGKAVGWDQLVEALATADLVISTTGAERPIVTLESFRRIERLRQGGPLLVLDLAVPRDFDPEIAQRPDVYLYSIDDLKSACQRNLRDRQQQMPAALAIIEDETERFLAEWRHRATAPIIEQLRRGWQSVQEEELRRLFNKLPELSQRQREEIRRCFERVLGKLMHPPLESLREHARQGFPGALLDALAKLFQLKD